MSSESHNLIHPREWLTEAEAASRLSMSKKWLQKMRLKGGGPRYAKFGSAVRYSLKYLEEFEEDSLRLSTSDVGGREPVR
ncbi:helix-turn-helix domain-containing protein [Aurantiacibacter arachoides]|uniref:helix-turn-helix domain-containing protein n=1 Tax=Aurantiacibacter arachoides TaxID=1850444 RepID=UPI0019BE5777|nr:hypothetical protein GCM10011411_26460 [Aurantiacibacter arachoides]